MSRIARFVHIAGCRGALMTAILAGAMVYVVIARPEKGRWEIFVPTALACFGAAYVLRNLLVDHFEGSRRFLNGAVIVGMVGSVVLRKSAPTLADSMEMTFVIAVYLGLYVGCYFWLLSDPRIGRSED